MLPRLWPPGVYAIGASTARVASAFVDGARARIPALTVLDGDPGPAGRAVLLPLEIGPGRVRRRVWPTLTVQENTELASSLAQPDAT
jgi:malate/lactate dehydrogenase